MPNSRLIVFTSAHESVLDETSAAQILSLLCWKKGRDSRIRQIRLESKIVDFLCLLPTPVAGKFYSNDIFTSIALYSSLSPTGVQEPLGLAVLTEDELVIMDVNMETVYSSPDNDFT